MFEHPPRAMNRSVALVLVWTLALVPIVLALIQEACLLDGFQGREAPLSLHARLLLPAALATAAIAVHLASVLRIRGAGPEEPRPRVRWLLVPLLTLCAVLLPRQILGVMDLAQLLQSTPWAQEKATCTGALWTLPETRIERLSDGSRILTLHYRHDFSHFAAARILLVPSCTGVQLTAPGYRNSWPVEAVSELPAGRLPSEFEARFRIPPLSSPSLESGEPVVRIELMAVGFGRDGNLLQEQGLWTCRLDPPRALQAAR